MVTQAEVIYVDEVLRHCSVANEYDEKSSSSQAPKDDTTTPAAETSAGPPSDDEPPGSSSIGSDAGFFDPLLNIPPSLLALEKERELHSTWSTPHGIIVLIPLRLGLDSLNPAYIPGNDEQLQVLHL